MVQAQPTIVVVDWGTSQLRVWPLDHEGNVLANQKSGEGMRTIGRDEFEGVLESHLAKLGIDQSVPVILCGMVGSRQGWQEAPYIDIPCKIEDVARHAVRVSTATRDVRILPGLAKRSDHAPDVMRSEETQLLGLMSLAGDEVGGHVCMPGSHAKWVRFERGVVVEFATGLTGELFAALGASSVLKHALASAKGKVDGGSDIFLKAVRDSLNDPATFLTRLFSVRPQSLLNAMSDEDVAAHVSGTIVGQDIAGAKAQFSPMHSVVLVGSGHLDTLYQSALEAAGLSCRIYDGDALAVAGLSSAAQAIWPDRLSPNKEKKWK